MILTKYWQILYAEAALKNEYNKHFTKLLCGSFNPPSALEAAQKPALQWENKMDITTAIPLISLGPFKL